MDAEGTFRTNAQAVLGLRGSELRAHATDAMMDLGCGDGSFLQELREALGDRLELHGMDESAQLLEAGQARYPHITFVRGDLRQAPELCGRTYGAVFLIGTHSIFEDVRSWLDSVLCLTRPGGLAFVLGLFNPEPFDTLVTWRRHADANWNVGGYNCWSVPTVARRLRELECAHDFDEVPFDTSFIDELDESYPMTFRRVSSDDGMTRLVNGLQICCHYYLLTLRPDQAAWRRAMHGRRTFMLRERSRRLVRRVAHSLQARYLRA